jgi:hypothetical protein
MNMAAVSERQIAIGGSGELPVAVGPDALQAALSQERGCGEWSTVDPAVWSAGPRRRAESQNLRMDTSLGKQSPSWQKLSITLRQYTNLT